MHQSRLKIYFQMILCNAKTIQSDTAVHLVYLGNTYLQCFQLLLQLMVPAL